MLQPKAQLSAATQVQYPADAQELPPVSQLVCTRRQELPSEELLQRQAWLYPGALPAQLQL